MRGAAAVLGLLVLFLLPAAAACTLAGEPPLPARMWVWDLGERREVEAVDLWSRGLDADCGLLVAHDLQGNLLAYADRAGNSQGVWLRDLDTDAPPRLVFRLDGLYQDLDLHGDVLSIYLETQKPQKRGADSLPLGHFFTVNLTTGQARRADLAPDWLGNPLVEEGVATWDGVRRGDYAHRFNAYDLAAGAWLEQNVSYAHFGVGEKGSLVTANRDWVILWSDEAMHAYHRPSGQRHALDPNLTGFRLDGDRLFFKEDYRELWVRTLPNGTADAVPLPPERPFRPLFRGSAIDGDRAVLGVYSLPDEERTVTVPPPWVTRPALTEDYPLPEAWRHEGPAAGFLDVPASSAALTVLAVAVALGLGGRVLSRP